MRYPEFLKDHDKISMVAVSFGATTYPYDVRLKHAVRKFNKLGYEVEVAKNVNEAVLGYLANTPELVAKEFMDYYLGDSKLLLSVGGGEMQCLTLPYLDFEKLKTAEPKMFCGFSDNTNYTFLLATLCDVASIYGLCAGNFAMHNWYQNVQDNYELFKGEKLTFKGYDKFQLHSSYYTRNHPMASYNLKWDKVLTTYPSENLNFEGRLLGGCLDILILLCGTKYDKVKEFNERYKEDGVIWFLEACDLNNVGYMRALFQLKEAGWFETAKGFLIGRPARAFNDDSFDLDRLKALDILKDLNVPIVADFDLGHIAPTMPILVGSYGKVKVNKNDISLEMELR